MNESIIHLSSKGAPVAVPLDGRAVLRVGIALILIWYGYMKFLP